MAESRFEYRGDLAVSPVAEALSTIHRYRVPGVLTAVREGIEKKIFVWNGDVIFATSGDRADSLGDFLLRTGRITQENLDRSVELLLLSGGRKRHGEVLVEMGVLTADAMTSVVTEQVRTILFSVFAWEDGEFVFQVGQYRTDELIQLNVPTRQAILEGIRSLPESQAKRYLGLIGASWTILDPKEKADELADVELTPGEREFLERIDGSKTLRDLVAIGPGSAARNACLLYAFVALRLVGRRDSSSGIKKLHWNTAGGSYAAEE